MLKAGLVGLGGMGRGHLDIYLRLMREKFPVQLVALCDIDPDKFKNFESTLNLKGMGEDTYNFSDFHLYTKVDEMLAKEELDVVAVVVPTYEHSSVSRAVLSKGIHCLSEKPMALTLNQCQLMIDTARTAGKNLMIGQCLRFWGEYMVLKDFVQKGTFGKPMNGYFYRGGSTPTSKWYLEREKGGGALFDQHIHDVDMVQYLFGMPRGVSSRGTTGVPGSGYDIVSTNYIFDEQLTVNSQDDWMISESGFSMCFRVNFEDGSILYDHAGFRCITRKTRENVTPEYVAGLGHYNETKYFLENIINGTPNLINPPEDSMNTIKLALAETKSCDLGGEIVLL